MPAVKIKNNAASRLASSLTAAATSIPLNPGDGAKFPSITGSEWFPVTLLNSSNQLEIVRCTARAGDTLTVVRGQEGTAAITFDAGDRVELRITAAAFAEFMQDYQFSAFIKSLIGDADAAEARSTLGLVLTTSSADTTAGRVLKVGDFAIGAAADTLVIPQINALDGSVDLNTITNPGWYYRLIGGAAGSRNANHPDGQAALAIGNGAANYYWILVGKYSSNVIQIALPYVSSVDTTNASIKYRLLGAGTWSSWKTLMMETLTKALNEAPIVTLASASTVDIGAAAANTINISGTTTITALGTIGSGSVRRLIFQGALTLTHNAASLILPGAANITTAAGDVAEFVSLGSGNWRCISYIKANGESLGANPRQLANAWVNFNGTGTVAIRDSFNVSSITDNGTGDYTVNFATAMANANYQVSGSVGPTNGSAPNGVVIGAGPALGTNVDPTTAGFRVLSVHSGATLVDIARIGLSVFGGK